MTNIRIFFGSYYIMILPSDIDVTISLDARLIFDIVPHRLGPSKPAPDSATGQEEGNQSLWRSLHSWVLYFPVLAFQTHLEESLLTLLLLPGFLAEARHCGGLVIWSQHQPTRRELLNFNPFTKFPLWLAHISVFTPPKSVKQGPYLFLYPTGVRVWKVLSTCIMLGKMLGPKQLASSFLSTLLASPHPRDVGRNSIHLLGDSTLPSEEG